MSEETTPAETARIATTPVDLATAIEFLHEHLGTDTVNELMVSALGAGAWSTAFGFTHENRELVIRFGNYPDDFERDRLAFRFCSPSLPIPQVIKIGRSPELDCHFAISERMQGTFIDKLGAEEMRGLLSSLFETLDAMREADISTTTGYGGWDIQGNAPFASWQEAMLSVGNDSPEGRGHGWRVKLEHSPTGSSPFEEAHARLSTLVAEVDVPVERHLVHSDMLNFNVLVSGDRISAIFDWGCATTGDILYDLAWFTFWGTWYPAWNGIDFPAEAKRHFARIGLHIPQFDERLRCCMIQIGLDSLAYNASIGNWQNLEDSTRRMLEVARDTRIV